MMAFFLLMVAAERHHRGAAARARGILRAHQPAGAFRFGSGQPFGGRTPNEEGNTVSTSGVLTIQPGPQPVVMDIEDDDSDMPARPVPRRTGPEGPEDLDETPRPAMEAPPYPRPGAEAPRGGPAEAPSSQADPTRISEAALRHELAQREQEAFEQTATQLREAIAADPALADLARQLLVEQTGRGCVSSSWMRTAADFALGGSAPNERALALLVRVAQAASRLPKPVAISGYTDATPFRGGGDRSNWDLSAERANATRRLLLEAGLPEARIRSVSGHADRDPLLPDQPQAAANRRVSITLLRQVPTEPAP